MTPVPQVHPERAEALEAQVAAALDDFLKARLASPLKVDQKAMTRVGVDHLKRALKEARLPLADFVAQDGLARYIDKLEQRVSAKYIEHLKEIWRHAFRFLCGRRLLAMDYARCVVPSEQKDPYDLETAERGFDEAWLGIFPRSILPRKAAASIRANEAVSDAVKKEFRHLVANRPERRRDSTGAVYWFCIRELANDLKLQSLKELADLEGAKRLMAYFLRKGYVRDSATVRKIRMFYSALQDLGLMGNPFKLKARIGEVLVWAIDFNRLPETSPRSKFFRVEGRRHTRIDGEAVECRLPEAEVHRIAAFGNPALRGWRSRPAAELKAVFREAQENLLARTVLYHPARPVEVESMNWRDWRLCETSEHGDVILRNNAVAHRRKKRPDRVVPAAYIQELETLMELRRAVFGPLGDPDKAESVKPGMRRRGMAMWAHPEHGRRMTALTLRRALRAALLRMGVPKAIASRVTFYWFRKAHQTLGRNHAKGLGDKFLAAQAGHSENVMKKHYDGPEVTACADFLRENVWRVTGVVPAAPGGKQRPGTVPGGGAAGEYVQGADLSRFAAEFLTGLSRSATQGLTVAEVAQNMNRAALKAGLFVSFQEAADTLEVDLRTIERWETSGVIKVVRLERDRYIMKAQVNELAQCLSPEEAGRQVGMSGRQIRNLIHDGKFKGAIACGKKWLLPWSSVRAFQGGGRRGACS